MVPWKEGADVGSPSSYLANGRTLIFLALYIKSILKSLELFLGLVVEEENLEIWLSSG